MRFALRLTVLALALGACRATPPPASGICSLSGAELSERLAWIDRLIDRGCDGVRELDDGWILRFRDTPEVCADLERLVAGERACCSTLEWSLTSDDSRHALLFELAGSREAKALGARLIAGHELARF